MLFMWGICPVCRKPLVKVEPGTMEFKPCREHPHATPEIKPLCRACMRKIVTPQHPILHGQIVCHACYEEHVAWMRKHAGPYFTVTATKGP
jgi:uncharacterized protein YbaR (Trm112 family)